MILQELDLAVTRYEQLYIKNLFSLHLIQVRKLEFIFAEALEENCDVVVTGGSIQSNHSRATAIVAKELGINSHLLLFPPTVSCTQ